jgi:TRAP-type C4-dicarboxylate transport system permease small subunit
MPRTAAIALAVGGAMSFVDGGLGLIGWTICGAFGMGFIIAGFAIAHHRTRGKPARGLLLWVAYLSTVLFTVPLAFFLFLGLFDTARTLTATGSGPNSKT